MLSRGELVVCRQPVDRLHRLMGAAVHLGAIAGGQDGRFLGGTMSDQIAQCRFHRFNIERNLFAHSKRRGFMVYAKSE